ncbi:sensor histidine kinase [Paenibacillus alginolyticus]|uniref:sensor histidine kinase n=1 Tax=Paenibacillus alginolyticus TaxID=59839 RepID=UPI000421A63C|nr:sensor histidine kinase [Paenibacillus alginolyticus]MCY9666741.1 sensor histidine kinase [Paenibacillus alginolyticus]
MISKTRMIEWFKLKNYRLRSKLIITYMLLTVVPMSLLGYISYNQYTKSIEEQVGEYVPRILDQANENIDKRMAEFESLSELLYNSSQVVSILRKDSNTNPLDLLNDRFTVNSFLSKTYTGGNSDPILGVFVWSKKRLFYSTKVPYSGFEQELDLSGKSKIILPNETDLQFKGNPPYILIKKQIWDFENRKSIGSIFIAVRLSFIEKVLHDMDKQDKAEIWIANQEGQVIYHTVPSQIGKVLDASNYPLKNGSFRSYRNGERKLISVSQSMQTDWMIVNSISFKYITKNTDLVLKVMIFLFFVVVLITSLISIFMAWSVSLPLHKLSRLMKNVEDGNFQVDLHINSRDEVGALASSFNSMVYRIRNLIQQNYHIELRQKKAELYALQSQINPHFMYNTLETISMAVEEDEKETVVEMVTLLGRMLRFSLSNKDRFVKIDKEVEHVKNYLTIQKYRFEQRLNFKIQSVIDVNQYFSPKFILQPIIENCIKHGFETRKGATIRIHVEKVRGLAAGSEDIIFKIQDDGTGIDQKTLAEIHELMHSDPIAKRDSGFGLINVHARIIMMFGMDYGLTIESELTKGTVVMIRIPVIEDHLAVEKYVE